LPATIANQELPRKAKEKYKQAKEMKIEINRTTLSIKNDLLAKQGMLSIKY